MALSDFLKDLPMDTISEYVARVVFWWIQLVKGVPDDQLATYAYFGMSALVLLLWLVVWRVLPRPLRGMSWVIVAAVLLTPGTSLGGSDGFAPAIIGVAHGILMKDTGAVASAMLSIVGVILAAFVLIGVWQFLRAGLQNFIQRSHVERTIAEHTGNYD